MSKFLCLSVNVKMDVVLLLFGGDLATVFPCLNWFYLQGSIFFNKLTYFLDWEVLLLNCWFFWFFFADWSFLPQNFWFVCFFFFLFYDCIVVSKFLLASIFFSFTWSIWFLEKYKWNCLFIRWVNVVLFNSEVEEA